MCPRPPSLPPGKQADVFVEMPSTPQVPCGAPLLEAYKLQLIQPRQQCNSTPHHPRHPLSFALPSREMANPSVVPPVHCDQSAQVVLDGTLQAGRMEVEPFKGFCIVQRAGIQRKKLQTQSLEGLQKQGALGLSPPFTTSHYPSPVDCPGQAACFHFSPHVVLVPRPLVYRAPLQPRTVVVQEPTQVENMFIEIPSTSVVMVPRD